MMNRYSQQSICMLKNMFVSRNIIKWVLFLILNFSLCTQSFADHYRVTAPNGLNVRASANKRENWDDYHKAYEDMLEHTSTDYAPWYVVPADNKWFTRFVVSEVMLDLFEQLDPQTPKLSKEEESQLDKWKKVLLEQDEKDEKED